jgi:hypothetical protein
VVPDTIQVIVSNPAPTLVPTLAPTPTITVTATLTR